MKARTGFVSNSSSSSFICSTDKTPEEVKEILIEILKTYNKVTGDQSLEFEDAFEHIFYGDANYNAQLSYYSNMDTTDKVVITSAGDNSIPWCLFDLIEYVFHARRVHLG